MPMMTTPGVYITEADSFPNAVTPVATAVPAFIGYTPRAGYQGTSYYNKPVRITSLAEYMALFSLPAPQAQYSPQYYLVEQASVPAAGASVTVNNTVYAILPDPNTIYYLYNAIRLFFLNGGGAAWVVSVGPYGAASGAPVAAPGVQAVNPNVKLSELQAGLALLEAEPEPTLYLCPEATLLSPTDNAALVQAMLTQAERLETAFCLFDVVNGNQPTQQTYSDQITAFRLGTGPFGLKYGACYYPFIGTTIIQAGEITYANLFGGTIAALAPLLDSPANPNPVARKIIDAIENPPANPLTPSQLHSALLSASLTYTEILQQVTATASILPPSAAMAGVYTVNDATRGVWNSPANTSIVGAASLPIQLTDSQQAALNVDAITGKSINVIRQFAGQGILIWGARTLDGNSQDWRYVSVRRTMTFLERSVKLAAQAYIFAPNDANTWAAVKSMIGSFLTDVWKQGGLQGAKPSDAFSVEVGLGSTMTPGDLLNGYMRVTVLVAVVRPAEFIEITFQQKMATSG